MKQKLLLMFTFSFCLLSFALFIPKKSYAAWVPCNIELADYQPYHLSRSGDFYSTSTMDITFHTSGCTANSEGVRISFVPNFGSNLTVTENNEHINIINATPSIPAEFTLTDADFVSAFNAGGTLKLESWGILGFGFNPFNIYVSDGLSEPTPSPTPVAQPVQVIASPSVSTVTINQPFTVDVKIHSAETAWNAAQATVDVSSSLTVTGLSIPTSGACNLHYTDTPSQSHLSFAGAVFNGSATDCTVYTLTLTPTEAGTGTVTFTNASIKSYADSSEILTGVQNGSFTIDVGATPSPTPSPLEQLTVTSSEDTYDSSWNLTGTRDPLITSVFVNGSAASSTYPTSTTWLTPVSLSLGVNSLTLYGKDDSNNQTATMTTIVNRHILGDINGDGVINIIDASLFAVDWGKTQNLTYRLSDMNSDGSVDLTDLSILAKLES